MSDEQPGGKTKPNSRVRLSRRVSLQWMGALAGGLATTAPLPKVLAEDVAAAGVTVDGRFADWPEVQLQPVKASGYGTDPNLIVSQTDLWPRLLNESQLALCTGLAGLIVPAEGEHPSAADVGVVDVVDEWISAPYPRQQRDRLVIVAGLRWLDDEAQRRFDRQFMSLQVAQQTSILDDIAGERTNVATGLVKPSEFFATLRMLVVGAYYTTPAGTHELGYVGNVPIAGDYPGPSKEALAHLDELLRELNLAGA